MKARFAKVHIENISIYNYNFIILLRADGSEKVLPICIGPAEAHSIAAAFNNKPFRRPLSHDLMKNVLEKLDCTVDRILVTDLKEGTFYARIFLKTDDGSEWEVDSRPSDAIALAIRYKAGIFVRQDILDENSVEMSESEGGPVGVTEGVERDESDEVEDTDPVSKLKKKLEDAVREERYEEAAKLRDEIQNMMGN